VFILILRDVSIFVSFSAAILKSPLGIFLNHVRKKNFETQDPSRQRLNDTTTKRIKKKVGLYERRNELMFKTQAVITQFNVRTHTPTQAIGVTRIFFISWMIPAWNAFAFARRTSLPSGISS